MYGRIHSGTVLRSATFGCVPVSDDASTRARLNDLCEVLGVRLGVDIRPHRAPSPAALVNAYRAGRVHLAWTSPALAATDPGLRDAVPLVHSVRFGAKHYHSVLFARADHDARLEGAHVAWVAASSAGGYLFARRAMVARGLEPEATFASERFVGSHGAVVAAVSDGEVDVGATFGVFEHGDAVRPLLRAGFGEDPEALSAFRVLLTSEPIPSDVVVAAPALLNTLRTDPVEALEQLHLDPRGAAALEHVLGAESLERCAEGELEALSARLIA